MATKFITYSATGAVTGCYSSQPKGVESLEITDDQFRAAMKSSFGWQGWSVAQGELVAPPPAVAPTADELAAQQLAAEAQVALRNGITIMSTLNSALNGTYAVDQVSQMDVIAIETSLHAGKGFPGGASPFNYPDVDGTMHAFSADEFTNFAAAVRDYVYALRCCIGGTATALPSSTVTMA